MAYIEIGVFVLAISVLLGFAHVDRKQELQRRKNKAMADSLVSRLRVLESITLELNPLYRSANIESFLQHALRAYLTRLLKLKNDTELKKLVDNWEKRVVVLTSPNENETAPTGNESGQPASGPDNKAQTVDFRESKYLLKDLYSAIIASTQDGLISHSAGTQLVETAKTLITKVSVDTYDDAANQAEARGDLNLAKHCYSMALKRLSEAANNSLKSAETVLKQKLRDVQAKLDVQSEQLGQLARPSDSTQSPALSSVVSDVGDDESWQKRRF